MILICCMIYKKRSDVSLVLKIDIEALNRSLIGEVEFIQSKMLDIRALIRPEIHFPLERIANHGPF
jgi:hypothetical protein